MQPEERDDAVRIVGGVVRRMDSLGRVVVPAEQRRALGIRQGDLIETRLEYGRVVIVKVEPKCALCGAEGDLIEIHDKHVCNDCVRFLVEAAIPRCDVSQARRQNEVLSPAPTPIR